MSTRNWASYIISKWWCLVCDRVRNWNRSEIGGRLAKIGNVNFPTLIIIGRRLKATLGGYLESISRFLFKKSRIRKKKGNLACGTADPPHGAELAHTPGYFSNFAWNRSSCGRGGHGIPHSRSLSSCRSSPRDRLSGFCSWGPPSKFKRSDVDVRLVEVEMSR